MEITADTRFRPVARPLSVATAQAELSAAWDQWIRLHPDATKLDAEDYITEAAKEALGDPSYEKVREAVGQRDEDLRDWVASVIIGAGALATLEG